MKRLDFLKKYGKKILTTFLLLAVAAYTFYQVVGTVSASIVTSPVKEITDIQKIGGQAYLFRDEKLLETPAKGVVNPIAADGEKVAKGKEVASVWTSYAEEKVFTVQQQLNLLNREISILEKSLVPAGTSLANAQTYKSQAKSDFMQLKKELESGNYQHLSDLEEDMLVSLNKLAELTNDESAVQNEIQILKQQRDALLQGDSYTLFATESSAYYYAPENADGYEALFSADRLESLSPAVLEELSTAEPADTSRIAGKLVLDYEWFLAVRLEADVAQRLEADTKYTLTFPENQNLEFSMTCKAIYTFENEVIALFSSTVAPNDFSYLRMQSVQISVEEIHGYYIPQNILRKSKDGTPGVYVFEENLVTFRKVDVIFQGSGYVIASTDSALVPNDLMIVSGKNLYDGRKFQ